MEKADIKRWLKDTGRNREWLALQLGIKKRSVDNWFSSQRNIAVRAQIEIARLMEQYPAGTSASSLPDAPENTLVLTADESTFDAWNEAAAREGKLLRQWACDVLTEQASKGE